MIEFAKELAWGAGRILLEHFGQAKVALQKGPIDFVTDADLASEKFLVGKIKSEFPEHGVVTEEQGAIVGREYTWLLDPLDGTINYLHGYPQFAVTVALLKEGQTLFGVVFDPIRGEFFWGERGKGGYLDKQRLKVSATVEIIASLVTSGFPYDIATSPHTNLEEFANLALKTQGPRCSGSAALDMCYLAAGRVDAYWETGIKPWDIAAGALLVEEAGGRVSDYRGNPWQLLIGEVLATNGLLHDSLVNLLSNSRSER